MVVCGGDVGELNRGILYALFDFLGKVVETECGGAFVIVDKSQNRVELV